jgi:hypothetical protein
MRSAFKRAQISCAESPGSFVFNHAHVRPQREPYASRHLKAHFGRHVGRSPPAKTKPQKTSWIAVPSLSGGLNKATMFDELHFKSTKAAGE